MRRIEAFILPKTSSKCEQRANLAMLLFLCCSKEDQQAGLCELQPPWNRPQHESVGGEQDQEGAGAPPGALLDPNKPPTVTSSVVLLTE